jgi:hypothetical protein
LTPQLDRKNGLLDIVTKAQESQPAKSKESKESKESTGTFGGIDDSEFCGVLTPADSKQPSSPNCNWQSMAIFGWALRIAPQISIACCKSCVRAQGPQMIWRLLGETPAVVSPVQKLTLRNTLSYLLLSPVGI